MRVLVLEDTKLLRDMIRRALEMDNFEVRVAADSPEAIDILVDGWWPDICLVDYSLPSGTGTAFIRAARDVTTAEFVGMSCSHSEAENEFAAMGVLFIQKPFNLATFRKAVEEGLTVGSAHGTLLL